MTVYTTVRRLFCVYSEECLLIRQIYDMVAGRGFIAIAAIHCGQGRLIQSSIYAILKLQDDIPAMKEKIREFAAQC